MPELLDDPGARIMQRAGVSLEAPSRDVPEEQNFTEDPGARILQRGGLSVRYLDQSQGGREEQMQTFLSERARMTNAHADEQTRQQHREETGQIFMNRFRGADWERQQGNYDRQQRLWNARYADEEAGDSVGTRVSRAVAGVLPGGFLVGMRDRAQYQGAMQRFRAGNPEQADYSIIAEHERHNRESEVSPDFWSRVGHAALHAPAMIGEVMAGGGLARGALGGFAQTAPLLTRAAWATRGAAASSLATFGAQLAATPSMYAEGWQQNNYDHDRAAFDPRGLPAPLAHAAIMQAIFGQVGNIRGRVDARLGGGLLGLVGGNAAAAATGIIEDQAAHTLSRWAGLDTPYGSIHDLITGKPGALGDMAGLALTFTAFAQLHGGRPEHPTGIRGEREYQSGPAGVMEAFQDNLGRLRRQELGETGAAERLQPAFETFNREVASPEADRTSVRRVMEALPEGPVRRMGLALADTMPEQMRAQGPHPGLEGQPASPAASQPRPVVPEAQAPAQTPPTQPAKTPEAPSEHLRALADFYGVKHGKKSTSAEIEAAIATKPGGKEALAALKTTPEAQKPPEVVKPPEVSRGTEPIVGKPRESTWATEYQRLRKSGMAHDKAAAFADAHDEAGQHWLNTGTQFHEVGDKTTFKGKNGQEYHLDFTLYPEGHELYQHGGVLTTIHDASGKEVGKASFVKKADGSYYVSSVQVHDNHRGAGIAKAMYDYLDTQGRVVPSKEGRSGDGKRLWESNARERSRPESVPGEGPVNRPAGDGSAPGPDQGGATVQPSRAQQAHDLVVGQGMSLRAAAKTLGVSHEQVRKDVNQIKKEQGQVEGVKEGALARKESAQQKGVTVPGELSTGKVREAPKTDIDRAGDAFLAEHDKPATQAAAEAVVSITQLVNNALKQGFDPYSKILRSNPELAKEIGGARLKELIELAKESDREITVLSQRIGIDRTSLQEHLAERLQKDNEAVPVAPADQASARPATGEPEPAPARGGAAGSNVVSGPEQSKLYQFGDKMEKDAAARIKDKLGGTLFSGFDPTLIADVAQFVAGKIIKGAVRGGYSFAEFSKAIVGRFGDSVKPHIQKIWTQAVVHASRELAPQETADVEKTARRHALSTEAAQELIAQAHEQAAQAERAQTDSGAGAAEATPTAIPAEGGVPTGFGQPPTSGERAAGGFGGGQPGTGEQPAQQRGVTGLAKDLVAGEIERSRGNLAGLPTFDSVADTERLAVAKSALARDPLAGFKLVDELAKTGRQISTEEAFLLLVHKTALSNEHLKSILEIGKLRPETRQAMDPVELASMFRREEELASMVNQFNTLTRNVSHEAGGTLRVFGLLMKEDFTFPSLLRRASAAAADGKPLTQEERTTLAEHADKMDKLQKKLAEAEAALEASRKPDPKPAQEGMAEPGGKLWKIAEGWEKESDAVLKGKAGSLADLLWGESGTLDLEVVSALAKRLAARIVKKGYSLAEWLKDSAKGGEDIKPHIQEIWAKAQEHVKEAQRVEPKPMSKPAQEELKPVDPKAPEAVAVQEARIDAQEETFKIEETIQRVRDDRLSTAQRVLKHATDVLDASRAIITSVDLSAVFRQGGMFTFAHPILAAKAFPEMIRSLGSERAAKRAMDEINHRENALLYRKSDLYLSGDKLSSQEESYIGRWVKELPFVAASERAYTTFLNRMRADVFDSMVGSMGRQGKVTDVEAKVIANFINVATGRGNLGMFEKAAVPLSRLFFSPRFVASRFQLLAGQPLWQGNAKTRLAIAGEYARALGGLGLFYALAKLAGGDDTKISADPRSSDFGKVRIGNTRIDPLAGLAQEAVFAARLISGETTSSVNGRTTPLRGARVPFGGTTVSDVIGRFLRTKLAPVPGAVMDTLTGKNAVGQPTQMLPHSLSDVIEGSNVASNLTMPIAIRDVWDAMTKDQGLPRGVAASLLAILGMGTQVYDGRRTQQRIGVR